MKYSLLIVVPTLNSYDLLPRLIQSLRDQTWPHWRLLFIDGPSCAEHRRWLEQCCASDSRCSWIPQDPIWPGIFGAMNQGFAKASPDDWLLFWGSDDWAASTCVLSDAIKAIDMANRQIDLIVCSGRYVDSAGVSKRTTSFHHSGFFDADSFRRFLFLGSTPPHQATLIGPRARGFLSRYSSRFRLSADLAYFLKLSNKIDLMVQCVELEIVCMADSGVSNQQTFRRLDEVRRAYLGAFGFLWWFPFIARYIKRLLSLQCSH